MSNRQTHSGQFASIPCPKLLNNSSSQYGISDSQVIARADSTDREEQDETNDIFIVIIVTYTIL